jgi:hypothetical protein
VGQKNASQSELTTGAACDCITHLLSSFFCPTSFCHPSLAAISHSSPRQVRVQSMLMPPQARWGLSLCVDKIIKKY